ncbi:hypothetical protein lerEdw1_008074, partial [Lerista edwardsae]
MAQLKQTDLTLSTQGTLDQSLFSHEALLGMEQNDFALAWQVLQIASAVEKMIEGYQMAAEAT